MGLPSGALRRSLALSWGLRGDRHPSDTPRTHPWRPRPHLWPRGLPLPYPQSRETSEAQAIYFSVCVPSPPPAQSRHDPGGSHPCFPLAGAGALWEELGCRTRTEPPSLPSGHGVLQPQKPPHTCVPLFPGQPTVVPSLIASDPPAQLGGRGSPPQGHCGIVTQPTPSRHLSPPRAGLEIKQGGDQGLGCGRRPRPLLQWLSWPWQPSPLGPQSPSLQNGKGPRPGHSAGPSPAPSPQRQHLGEAEASPETSGCSRLL